MGFQSQVNQFMAPAVPGDFASQNPRATVLGPPGGYTAGAPGATVGNWVWATGGTVVSTGTGPVTGLVCREQQAQIVIWLADVSMVIPEGMPVTVYSVVDAYVKNSGTGAVTAGLKAFANLADGSTQFAAAGATVTGAVETKWFAEMACNAGEVCKISTYVLG